MTVTGHVTVCCHGFLSVFSLLYAQGAFKRQIDKEATDAAVAGALPVMDVRPGLFSFDVGKGRKSNGQHFTN